MLTSAANDQDLHGMTMDMLRTRILAAFYAFDILPHPELVEELARVMDMSAAERVLDEQDERDLPNPEHPAVRDLRDRLRHSETLICRLSVAPALRVATMIHEHTLTPNEQALLTRFAQNLHRDMAVPSSAGCGEANSVASARALHQALRVIDEHAALAESDHLPASAPVAAALNKTADEIRTMLSTLFRDAASLDVLFAPTAMLDVTDRLPHGLHGVPHGLMSSWSATLDISTPDTDRQ